MADNGWLLAEFARASERHNALPDWAKPVVTRPCAPRAESGEFLRGLEGFQARFAQARQRSGASFGEITAATGVAKSSLWKIEYGLTSPSLTTAARIERWILGVQPEGN